MYMLYILFACTMFLMKSQVELTLFIRRFLEIYRWNFDHSIGLHDIRDLQSFVRWTVYRFVVKRMKQ